MSDAINAAAAFAESGRDRLLHTLEHVPDDKLNWVPSATAHCALRIAAHAALSNDSFAMMLRGDPLPDMPFEKIMEAMEAAEMAVTTREQAVKLIEEKSAAAIAAIKALTPDRVAAEVQTPFGSMSIGFIMTIVGRHMDSHASQIDYLQTMWGDPAMHF